MADGDRVGGVYLEIGSEVAKGTPQDSIKRIRAAVKKAAAIKMPVALDNLKRADLTAARKLAQESADRVKEVQLPVELKKLTRSAATAARKAAQEVVDGGQPVKFKTDLEHITAKAITGVRRQAERIANVAPISFNVEAGKGATWQESVEDLIDDIEDREAELPVIPDVDTKWVSARLKWLSRPRNVPIVPKMDEGALGLVTTQLLALSGARAVTDRIRSLSNTLQNLDRTIPSIAGVSTALTNLGSAGLAGISNLLVIGGGLKDIGAIGLALPGMFAGFGVGIGVMVAALKDAGDVLSDLGPKFSALQDTISSNFWEKAEEPIRNLANTWLPTLNSRLGEVATELGTFFGSFSNALSSADNVGHLDSVLGNVRDSIDIAGDGIAHFTDAMMGLIDVGASYLPDLAGWFNRISEDFSAWIEQATESGEIFEWIDTGIQALQDLGRVVWGLGGVFANLGTAAAAAGGSTLGDLADGLENLNAAMEGPAFQGAMTTVFKGAHDAMAALGPGVSALGDAFLAFAPTLAEVMVLAGEVASVGLGAIAAAFENPAFQGGLTDFFEGLLSGVEAIAPHIPALAAAFGSVASFAGTLAAVLGPVLGAAIEALAPVVTDLMAGLSAIAPVLGGVLVSAIQAVAPFIQQIVGAITEWVVNNPQLAATILAVVGVIGGLIAGAASLIGALLPVVSTIVSIVTAIIGAGGLSAVLAAVSAGFSAFAAAAAPIIAVAAGILVGITALAGALIYAWNTSEAFRNAVVGLFQALMTAAQPVIAFITGTVMPVIMQIVQAVISGVTMILNALTPMMTVIIQIVTQIIAIMTPIIAFILSVFAPIFTYLGTVVSAAFTFIATIISSAINIVTAILNVFLQLLQGNWSAAWQAVLNVGRVIWESIKAVVMAGITYARTVITAGLTMIQGLWSAIWGAISGVASAVWSAIVSFVTSGINRAKAFVSSGMNAIKSIWTTVWNAVSSFVSSVLSRIVSTVSNGINSARNFVSNGLNAIRNFFSNVWNAIVSFVTSALSRVVSTISNGISTARSAVQSGMNAVRSVFSNVLNAVVSAVTSAIGRVVAGFRNMMNRARSTVQGFVSRFKSVGSNIVSGLVDGIKGAAGRAVSAAKGVVDGALSGAKNLLGISSPSKAFAEVGEWSGEGFVEGLEAMRRAAATASEKMVAPPAPASIPVPASAHLEGPVTASPAAGTASEFSGMSREEMMQAMQAMQFVFQVGQREFATGVVDSLRSVGMKGAVRV